MIRVDYKDREQCIDKCKECYYMISDENFGDVCDAYISPKAKWKNGNCNLATNIIIQVKEAKKVNPIKQSKRGKR